jgi:uracil phosphoribosyltransferase
VPDLPPTLHVSQHPALLHKLALLRAITTSQEVRELVREIAGCWDTRR